MFFQILQNYYRNLISQITKPTFSEVIEDVELYLTKAAELQQLQKEIQAQINVSSEETAIDLNNQLVEVIQLRENCLNLAEQLQQELEADIDQSMDNIEAEELLEYDTLASDFDDVLLRIEEVQDMIKRIDEELSKEPAGSQLVSLQTMKVDQQNALLKLYEFADDCKSRLQSNQEVQKCRILEMAKELQLEANAFDLE